MLAVSFFSFRESGIDAAQAAVGRSYFTTLMDLLEPGTPRLVVLDLVKLTALDTDGVGLLVDIAYLAGEADIGVCLVVNQTRSDLVTTPLAGAGMLALFEIHSTITRALDALG